MKKNRNAHVDSNFWSLAQSLDAILFDCDSTLSQIEGIDVIAKENGVYQTVHELTERAMAETGLSPALYSERMALVKPNAAQMARVAQLYWEHVSPDVFNVVTCLHALSKPVYVVSAGLKPSVAAFAKHLQIPVHRVYAVEVFCDGEGNYSYFDEKSPLTGSHGKSIIAEELKRQHPRLALIGDGMNDLEAAKAVHRFIGYGGNAYRSPIASRSPYYIRCASLAPVLPLVLSAHEVQQLKGEHLSLYLKGKALLVTDVEFRL